MEPLLEAYSKDNPGFLFMDQTQVHKFLQWIMGYVDDNSLIITFTDKQSTQEALWKAQQALIPWRKLVQVIGGDLGLEKCVYSYMGWTNHKGSEILGSIAQLPGTIEIDNNSRKQTTLKRIETPDSERFLGVRCGLDGSDDIELHYRIQEAQKLARRIKIPPLTRFDAEIVFRKRWMATIKYYLLITSITTEQYHQLSKIVEQAIPKLGFNRHMPKVVIYRSKQFGGRQLMKPHTE